MYSLGLPTKVDFKPNWLLLDECLSLILTSLITAGFQTQEQETSVLDTKMQRREGKKGRRKAKK